MEKQKIYFTFFSSIQWFFFIFANTIVVPISIASVFQLDAHTVEAMIRTSLIITGVVGMIQGWIGHQLPLMEGHSGLLWGVILNLGISASTMGLDLTTVGGGIATGIFLASVTTLLFAALNWVHILEMIFRPMVLTVYLFLLSFQLIFIFFKGMLKIDETGTINLPISLLSIAIVLLVSILKVKGNQFLSNFSILIGLGIGWLLFALCFPNNIAEVTQSSGDTFAFFPLGAPNLEIGIVIITYIAVMLNLTNTMASIKAGSELINEIRGDRHYRCSMAITSIFTMIGTCFGLVPYTPFTSSIGFLQSTRIFDRKSFILGGAILAIIGSIPIIASLLATMPITIGNAVLFVAYLQLFGTAYSSLNGKTFNSNTIFRIAVPLLVGVSLMNVSPEIFNSVPIIIRPFLSNGLIMGVLISVILETIVKWSKYDVFENKGLTK
ncbi:uracil/xanthine transporter [Bacillus massiliigorillae]|uniref:uracil/xanthine transporter n=1 Tax=Bacillus massiliigorillae TaxID=1243664 RepID=UPI00039F3B4B|nr:uracil/xanthine transporter [Bacillus massiliigorillae]